MDAQLCLKLPSLRILKSNMDTQLVSIQNLQGLYRQAIGSVTAIIPTQIHRKSRATYLNQLSWKNQQVIFSSAHLAELTSHSKKHKFIEDTYSTQ